MMNSQIIIGPDGLCPVSNCIFSGVDRGPLNHLFCCCSKERLIAVCVCCFTTWFPQAYFTSTCSDTRCPLVLSKKENCICHPSLPCYASSFPVFTVCCFSLLVLAPENVMEWTIDLTGLLAFWWYHSMLTGVKFVNNNTLLLHGIFQQDNTKLFTQRSASLALSHKWWNLGTQES